MTEALIVIDMQYDFCPGGALAVEEGDLIVPGINALIDEFPAVILTQDWHPAGHSSFASEHPGRAPMDVVEMPYGPQVLWPDHCVQNTAGAQLHPEIDWAPVDLIVRKGSDPRVDSYSAFRNNIGPDGHRRLEALHVRRQHRIGDALARLDGGAGLSLQLAPQVVVPGAFGGRAIDLGQSVDVGEVDARGLAALDPAGPHMSGWSGARRAPAQAHCRIRCQSLACMYISASFHQTRGKLGSASPSAIGFRPRQSCEEGAERRVILRPGVEPELEIAMPW